MTDKRRILIWVSNGGKYGGVDGSTYPRRPTNPSRPPYMSLDSTDPDATEAALDASLGSVPESVSDLELLLWVLVCWALVLDIVLTAYGLSIGLVERNPFIRHALDTFGVAALALSKAAAVGIALFLRSIWPEYAVIAPAGLAVPWLLAVALNAILITSV